MVVELIETEVAADKIQRKFMRRGTRMTRGQLRAKVLDVVQTSLRDSSYEKLAMEHIAASAEISRRTLYNLFEDKDELYRSCWERALRSVAAHVVAEIPERMSPQDGMRFFVEVCQDVYSNDDAIDLLLAVARDGTHQPWLVEAYHKDINLRLIQVCENFVLKKSRHKPLKPSAPRHIGEQLVGIVKSITVGPYVFGSASHTGEATGEQLDILANAYSAIIWDNRIGINTRADIINAQ